MLRTGASWSPHVHRQLVGPLEVGRVQDSLAEKHTESFVGDTVAHQAVGHRGRLSCIGSPDLGMGAGPFWAVYEWGVVE